MLQDLTFALRSFPKSPAFTLVAVLVLALGIGANTAVFSVVDIMLLHALPYRDPDRLVMLWESHPSLGGFLGKRTPVSIKSDLEWKEQSRSLIDMAVFENGRMIGVGIGLAGSFALTELMSSVIFGITPTDPVTFGAVAAGLTLIARRAARIDPMDTLRVD